MNLLSANPADGRFGLKWFPRGMLPEYAILSHVWEADDQEVTFRDLTSAAQSNDDYREMTKKIGFAKVRFCAERAKKGGLKYFWVDSCCIDKSSSAELSQAINSMWRWYEGAAKCYVYLSDVSKNKRSKSDPAPWESALPKSRWFTRGWTLQELLAPESVEFFSREGKLIGDKKSLELQIQKATKIPIEALRGASLSQFSREERMSWAADRQTTREEDEAYCLLGLFDAHMPEIYGEGKINAMRRLEEEIDRIFGASKRPQVQLTEEQCCVQSLRTSDYEQFKERNPRRVEGTCEWILQHADFRTWGERDSGLLWMSADPGCGKSVLSKSLIDNDFNIESLTTCYFFFRDDNDKQKDITIALSALLHQLFSRTPGLVKHAMPDYGNNGNKLPQSFQTLWKAFLAAAADPLAGKIVCILDAIDECTETGRNQFIDALKVFYETSASKRSQLRFLITSRPYLDIERQFADLIRSYPTTIRLHGERESSSISREINLVIKSEVAKLGRDLGLVDPEREILEHELLNMDHRTYLWLKLIIEVIRKEISLTKTKLKQIIGTLPATVDEAYESILSKVRERDKRRVQKLLHIIVAAPRPLTLKEMNIALSIEDHHKDFDDLELDLEDQTRFESSLRNLCGFFVSVENHKVYLIHQTAKEFLIANEAVTSQNEAPSSRWKHSIDPAESELVLARVCVTYLMLSFLDEPGDSPSSTPSTGERNLFSYASEFWAAHFQKAQHRATKELVQSAAKICDAQGHRFQAWFDMYWYKDDQTWPIPQFDDPIMVASYFGLEVVVELLLERVNVDVDRLDLEYRRTPLLWAAERGHASVVRLLLERGVNVNWRDEHYLTPLSVASQNGHEAVVKLLLSANGIDADCLDLFGHTPRLWAAQNGHVSVLRLLSRP